MIQALPVIKKSETAGAEWLNEKNACRDREVRISIKAFTVLLSRKGGII